MLDEVSMSGDSQQPGYKHGHRCVTRQKVCQSTSCPRLLEQVANWLSFRKAAGLAVSAFKKQILGSRVYSWFLGSTVPWQFEDVIGVSEAKATTAVSICHRNRCGMVQMLNCGSGNRGTVVMASSYALLTVWRMFHLILTEAWTEIVNSAHEWHLLVEDDVASL